MAWLGEGTPRGWENIISEGVCDDFSRGNLCLDQDRPHDHLTSLLWNPKVEEGQVRSPPGWGRPLLLPSDFSSPGSEAFQLGPGLIPLAAPVLGPSSLSWDYMTSFLGSPAYRGQITGPLPINNPMTISVPISNPMTISVTRSFCQWAPNPLLTVLVCSHEFTK